MRHAQSACSPVRACPTRLPQGLVPRRRGCARRAPRTRARTVTKTRPTRLPACPGEKRLRRREDTRRARASSEVGEREEAIGASAFARARVPGLHQGPVVEARIRAADARREEAEYPPRRVFAAAGFQVAPAASGSRRRGESGAAAIWIWRRAGIASGRRRAKHVAREQQHLEKELQIVHTPRCRRTTAG